MQQKTVYTLSLALFIITLVWGSVSFLSYLGVPVHESMLLADGPSASTMCDGLRGDSSKLPGVSYLTCRGIQDVIPFLGNVFARMQPFLFYIALSILVFAAFIGWRFLQDDSTQIRVRLRPWHILAGFVASLWLLFTVISGGTNEGSPFVRLAEPDPSIYVGLSEDTLQVLRDNFDDLQSRGCLTPFGQNDAGVTIYDMKGSCVQGAFVKRVLSQLLVSLVLLFELLVLGGALLRLLKFQPQRLLTEAMMSIGLGVAGWLAILWLLAALSIYTTLAAWLVLFAVPAICYKSTLYWSKRAFSHSWDVDVPWYSSAVVCLWILISLLALNFLTVIRPFPIGWDDLGSYLNRPRLLVSYGHIIHSMSSFQWEYLTSMGFRLFGYESFFGATAAMIINWTQGVLAVATLYLFSSTYLGRNRGLVAPVLYYFLPLVGHFSFADMKIDNAVFTMATLALFAVCMYLFPRDWRTDAVETSESLVSTRTDDDSVRGSWKWLVIAGVCASIAFSIKVTSVMALMAILAVMLGVSLHWTAFLGTTFLAFAAFIQRHVLDIDRIVQRALNSDIAVSQTLFMVLFALVGLGCIGYAVWRTPRMKLKTVGMSFVIFIGAFAATMLPWLAYNNIRAGNIVPRLETSFPNTLTPSIRLSPGTVRPGQELRTLPTDLAIDPNHAACKATGATEELDRYWGFDRGISHYLTLPWRTVMNLDSVGYYVTTTALLLLFPLLLLLPYFWTPRGKWLRYLFGGTIFILLEWMFLANGIPWYGLVIAAGLTVGLEALLAFAPDVPNRIAASVFITLSILCMFSMRMWQYEQQKNLFEYPMGKISAEALQERTIPWYDRIEEVVTERHETMPDRPYLYRVGTFIPYFIPKNLEVIGMTDHQLDFFNCLNQERNPELTLKRLKSLGFNSLVFDTNTATIETDPEGSLHKKVNAFVDFLNTSSLGLQVLVNDPQAGVAFILIP